MYFGNFQNLLSCLKVCLTYPFYTFYHIQISFADVRLIRLLNQTDQCFDSTTETQLFLFSWECAHKCLLCTLCILGCISTSENDILLLHLPTDELSGKVASSQVTELYRRARSFVLSEMSITVESLEITAGFSLPTATCLAASSGCTRFLAHTPSLLMGSIRLFKQQPLSGLPQLVVTDRRAHPISLARLTLPPPRVLAVTPARAFCHFFHRSSA